MNIIFIILFIVGLFLCYSGGAALKKAKDIKVRKEYESIRLKEQEEYLINEIENLINDKAELESSLEDEQKRIKDQITESQKEYFEQLKIYKQNIDNAKEKYIETLEDNYTVAENEYDDSIKQYEYELKNAESQLQKLKSSLSAGVQAQLREREKEENLQFYKLSISPIDLEDIIKLNTLKIALHQPVILSKLIWTQYFQKQTTEMCNRILGTKKICGIYKITNLKTQQCYIGQSVDVAQRWKDHCKAGCDIEASKTNKLYQSMINEGLWNFSFELLEQCPREQLNEKEKFWIELYQSNIYGLNSTKGNN